MKPPKQKKTKDKDIDLPKSDIEIQNQALDKIRQALNKIKNAGGPKANKKTPPPNAEINHLSVRAIHLLGFTNFNLAENL